MEQCNLAQEHVNEILEQHVLANCRDRFVTNFSKIDLLHN
jgi:hypothetical protein